MEPNDKELALMEEFKKRLCDIEERHFLEDATFLIKWIRARGHDLGRAEEMCRNSLKWRKEKRVDETLREEIPSDLMEIFPCNLSGFDKEGRPVLTMPFGEWDVRKQVEGGKAKDMIRMVIQSLEIFNATLKEMWLNEFPKKRSWPITQMTVIVDMKGYSYSQIASKKTIEMVVEVMKAYEANYPESLAKAFVINAPRIFSILFGMIKPLLSPATVEKIEIHDSNEAKWKKSVVDFIDGDQITSRYGGNKLVSY